MIPRPGSLPLQRTYIWSAPLRLSHALLALTVPALWATGWFMQHVPGHYLAARDYHLLAAWPLVVGLGLRLVLLFTGHNTAAGWRDLLPASWAGVRDTLRFYVTLGQLPLPRWYAHNPLWGPLYLLLFLVLALQIATGFLLARDLFPGGWSPRALHDPLAGLIGAFALLHVLAALVHDWRSGNSDVSAMLHGWRLFRLEKPPLPAEQTISLDHLKRTDRNSNG